MLFTQRKAEIECVSSSRVDSVPSASSSSGSSLSTPSLSSHSSISSLFSMFDPSSQRNLDDNLSRIASQMLLPMSNSGDALVQYLVGKLTPLLGGADTFAAVLQQLEEDEAKTAIAKQIEEDEARAKILSALEDDDDEIVFLPAPANSKLTPPTQAVLPSMAPAKRKRSSEPDSARKRLVLMEDALMTAADLVVAVLKESRAALKDSADETVNASDSEHDAIADNMFDADLSGLVDLPAEEDLDEEIIVVERF